MLQLSPLLQYSSNVITSINLSPREQRTRFHPVPPFTNIMTEGGSTCLVSGSVNYTISITPNLAICVKRYARDLQKLGRLRSMGGDWQILPPLPQVAPKTQRWSCERSNVSGLVCLLSICSQKRLRLVTALRRLCMCDLVYAPRSHRRTETLFLRQLRWWARRLN